jgi:hypothetical protein
MSGLTSAIQSLAEVTMPPCAVPLRTYKVVLQGGDIYVDLDKNAAGEAA